VKTYRKYEVIIRDLEIQNEQLAAKLKKEQMMRSPTKDYMNELLDKIVELKRNVEQLNERIDDLNELVRRKDEEIREQQLGIVRQDQLLRLNMNRLPSLEDKPVVK
jgi:predicted  nucleic acid-binding Zn-ribbon protein